MEKTQPFQDNSLLEFLDFKLSGNNFEWQPDSFRSHSMRLRLRKKPPALPAKGTTRAGEREVSLAFRLNPAMFLDSISQGGFLLAHYICLIIRMLALPLVSMVAPPEPEGPKVWFVVEGVAQTGAWIRTGTFLGSLACRYELFLFVCLKRKEFWGRDGGTSPEVQLVFTHPEFLLALFAFLCPRGHPRLCEDPLHFSFVHAWLSDGSSRGRQVRHEGDRHSASH